MKLWFKRIYERHTRTFLITVCVFCLAVSAAAGGYMGYRLLRVRQVTNIFNVEQKETLEYRVHIRENPYIDRPYLGMGENYLYSYTDYIELRSFYSFSASELINTRYEYQASATIVSRYNRAVGGSNNPEVMSKTYILEQVAEEINSDHFRLDRTYDIFLEPYKRELEDFAATVDANLIGEVRIDITVTLKNLENEDDTISKGVTIPLSSEFYTIETHGDAEKTQEHKVLEKPLSIWAILLLSLLILAGIAGVLACLKKLLDRRSAYRREIGGYLKSYDDVIVNTSTPIDFKAYRIVLVESFKELLNMSNKANSPIMYWENSQGAHFYIVNDESLLVLYTVKNPH
ncbi:MAG: DUF5305 domain-containing protein [Gracilibacteraceae bacterium]|nr:DUF5305 domain-containing protein [Gracilibacteraceae bacterium]